MSKISEAIQERKGNNVYVPWTKMQAITEEEVIPTGVFHGFGELNDYFIELRLSVQTRCNNLQWNHHQKKETYTRLMDGIYGEVKAHIHRAITATYGNDEEEILSCLRDALEAMD
jgi:hypothetical protein